MRLKAKSKDGIIFQELMRHVGACRRVLQLIFLAPATMSDLRQCCRQFLGEFMELYRSFPCLCQIKSAVYSAQNKKNQAYEMLFEKFKEIHSYTNKETVIKK